MRFFSSLIALCTAASALAAPAQHEARQTTLSGKKLTILPLGDSITYGIGSSSSNSYRQFLLSSLQSAGASVDYVGTVRSGTMSDKDNEGHPGWTIDQISGAVTNVKNAGIAPNVVLVHAGTNDCNTYGSETAYVRLGSLIDKVVAAWPQAAVVVAKIIPAQSANTQKNIQAFNSRVQSVVSQRANAGKRVSVVDMSTLNAVSDLSDSLHPNDQGFKKMANIWLDGVKKVNSLGWI